MVNLSIVIDEKGHIKHKEEALYKTWKIMDKNIKEKNVRR